MIKARISDQTRLHEVLANDQRGDDDAPPEFGENALFSI
jgi:hypothetical protein